MDLPRLDGVTHRTVAGPRSALPRRRGGSRRPHRARAWLAAALVDVAPRGAPARAASPSGDDRPARLRLVRRAARAYDKQTLADDLLAVLDALGLDRVGLIAHDWGAWSGFLACMAAPERFTAFLALGSAIRTNGASSDGHGARQQQDVLLALGDLAHDLDVVPRLAGRIQRLAHALDAALAVRDRSPDSHQLADAGSTTSASSAVLVRKMSWTTSAPGPPAACSGAGIGLGLRRVLADDVHRPQVAALHRREHLR